MTHRAVRVLSVAKRKSVSLLRDLRREVMSWQEIDPESALSLLDGAIGIAVATMIRNLSSRFCSR